MAIKNSVCNDFLSTFVDSINIDCRLSLVFPVWVIFGSGPQRAKM